MPEENVSAADKVGCDCAPCQKARGTRIASGLIHGYSSAPRSGWKARRTASEVRAIADGSIPAPTFGVELETDVPTSDPYVTLPGRPALNFAYYDVSDAAVEARREHERLFADWNRRNIAYQARMAARRNAAGNITADEAVSIAEPRGLWHAKHDGSVSGPEFASQPGTLAYWRGQRVHVTSMFKALLHGGMRSHDGGHCGLHVNIGTDAFGNGRYGWHATEAERREFASHLKRFADLVCANPRWSTRMAQRTHEQVSSWSPFTGPMETDAKRAQWAQDVAERGYAGQNRYCVLNASNDRRIEFRLPRGTLRVDRFFAKIEWVAAMVEYTRSADNVTQVSAFIRWVDASGEYPYLTAFMRERFAGRFAAEGTAVAA